jgi:hypothetical protein
MPVDGLPPWSVKDTGACLCGPPGFMRAQWKNLPTAGVPEMPDDLESASAPPGRPGLLD